MRMKVGAELKMNNTCDFSLWSPTAKQIQLLIQGQASIHSMEKTELGYWKATLNNIDPGTLYKFQIDGKELPDPASRFQPEGVHSWSQVVSREFSWSDDTWKGLSTAEMIIYELHVGTFTEEGSFNGIQEKLEHLKELGVNAIELMPLAQFPGTRNWGYDGVYPFAVQNSYGSRDSLKALVNECHKQGIAVLLDVVYNHMGPEGNYLSSYGPYFTEKYHTPWGQAINFDDAYSDEVRNFFLQNALMWLEEFHFDGLRLDAVHEIIDRGARHFLKELREAVDELENRTGRTYVLIAESDLNDARIVAPMEKGGYGLEAQWVDDFHHSLHTYLTGEKSGYYSDYGKLEYLKKTILQAFVYDGIYSRFRKKSVGNSPASCSPCNFLVSIQNHDQIGNRLLGERLGQLISFEALKLAAGVLLISPYVPMLFMGEEFGEEHPFQYFVSHSDEDLIKAVQEGRKKEFSYFFEENSEGFPDPQSEETFKRSKLNWDFRKNPTQNFMFEYYKFLLKLRNEARFSPFRNKTLSVEILQDELISISGKDENAQLLVFANFGKGVSTVTPPSEDSWRFLFSSADKKWGGSEDIKELQISKEIKVLGESIFAVVASG